MVVRFDLFERLNTGGIALTNQEIRACIYRGEFNEFLEEMAGNKDFQKSVRLTQKQEKDGTREECVLRFFSFLNNYNKFEHSVVDFLNNYMRDASKSFNYTRGRKIFMDTFLQIGRSLEFSLKELSEGQKEKLHQSIYLKGFLLVLL